MNVAFDLGQVLAGFFHAVRTEALASAGDGASNREDLILKEIRTMSDNITQLTALVGELKTKLQAAEDRDAARTTADADLKAKVTAQTAQIGAQTEQLTALQKQLADMPQDTSAQEAALAQIVTSLQLVSNGLDTIAADPAPEPTAAAPSTATTAEPAPTATAPAEPAPAAPAPDAPAAPEQAASPEQPAT